jgi:amino acid transporter
MMQTVEVSAPSEQPPLRLWDSVSIIIGIVIGVGIYKTAPDIFMLSSGPWLALAIWCFAGILSLIGAFCYAELGSTYPHSGGDYVYLTRAFHPAVGFLFGWAQFIVIRSGNIGMMAYVFGDYALNLWQPVENAETASLLYAIAAVTVLAVLNVLGVILGKGAQNLLTTLKIIGLAGIVVAGFLAPEAAVPRAVPGAFKWGEVGIAFVLVLYTYGGWNDAALVAAEQRNGKRNIALSLIVGTSLIALIYVLVNLAYLFALGYSRASHSTTIAADVLEHSLGRSGSVAISMLIAVSALGAINGMIFTGSRVYSTMGADSRLFAWLGRWHPRLGTPLWSLLTQWAITIALLLAVGTQTGQGLIDLAIRQFGFAAVQWKGHGFETLLSWTSPAFWLFFLLTGLSLFVLRWKDRDIERPFTVPLFPVFPLIFCATCVFMLYSATDYAGKLALVPAVLVLAGLPLYFVSRQRRVPALAANQHSASRRDPK